MFRLSVTAGILILITGLAVSLLFVQNRTVHEVTTAAANAEVDAASANTIGLVHGQVSQLGSLVRILSRSPSLAGSDDRSETDDAINLFKSALRELPQADSIYVGYDNGGWLQLRRVDTLTAAERERLKPPPNSVYDINLVRPTAAGALPLRRVFEDEAGNRTGVLDLPDYGYDARSRPWYREAMRLKASVLSAPYASYSIGTAMVTASAPLQGRATGVIGADLKLDNFSDLVRAQSPGRHGMTVIFDASGVLIAHPEFAQLAGHSAGNSAGPPLPKLSDIKSGPIAAVIQGWDHSDRYEGVIRDAGSHDYLFRLQKFPLDLNHYGYVLILAEEDDYMAPLRNLQYRGLAIALIAGACFLPGVWFLGGKISTVVDRMTTQARRLGRS